MTDPTSALTTATAPRIAALEFFHGPMDCGKSTLALQIDHNHARQGRRGLILTRRDRSGQPQVTSRLGLARAAVEIADDSDPRTLVRECWARGQRIDYLIVDEAQFLSARQVEQLAELVDCSHIDVYAFGLLTDFRSMLFPGSARLIELADRTTRVQVDVLCWCGRPGRFNGRVAGGQILRAGDTVVVADTAHSAPAAPLRYQVLCRAHFRTGELGPATDGAQLPLE